MSTPGNNADKSYHENPGIRDLEQKLRELGLDGQYWLPKFKDSLGVTSAQALQHLEQDELLKMKYQAQHPWEKRALEKLFQQSSSLKSERMQEKHLLRLQEREKQAKSALKELREMQAAGKSRQEKMVRMKEEELRQAMEIPTMYWPLSEIPLMEVIENMERNLRLMEGTLSSKDQLSARELLKQASGGLALQGIYKTNNSKDLLERREELLSLPEDFSLFSPEQETRMETKELLSSQEESMFSQSMEKLGLSISFLAKGGGWRFNLETNTNKNTSTDSRETHKSCSKNTYSCTTKFSYVPLASIHFTKDQLHLSKSALQELKKLDKLLSPSIGAEIFQLLRDKCEAFFETFGSHVNQGPLHLGGVFLWKAVAEGFRSEELQDVKKQALEVLDVHIGGSYSGFGVTGAPGLNISDSQYQMTSHNTSSTNMQARFQLSVYKIGGPPGVDSLSQWKSGLVANNSTWCVIDRGHKLVPVWEIILCNHREDFENALQVIRCLKDVYSTLTRQCARIQDEEELLSVLDDARSFTEEVKSWEINEPQVKFMKLMNLMQMMTEKNRNYNTWINICLKNQALQKFLLDIVSSCKDFPDHETKFIKSQLRSLLYPHIYQVQDFPERHLIMQWVFHSMKQQQEIHVIEFSDFIEILKKAKNDLEINRSSGFLREMEETQRKITYEISISLSSFLKTLRKSEKLGTHLLLLSVAAAAGYREENQNFHRLLGWEEVHFLLNEMKAAHEKYQDLNKWGDCSSQAFLLRTGLTVGSKLTTVSPEEKKQRLEHMQSHMEHSWCEEVSQVLRKHKESHDWEVLEKDLNFLISGKDIAIVNTVKLDEMKKELECVSQRNKRISKPEPSAIKKQESIKNPDFLDLAMRLGLEHYYPRKMSRADFNVIYKLSVHDVEPKTEKELPFYFLQKLLMLDYRLRYLVCKDDGDTKAGSKQTPPSPEEEVSASFDDFFDDADTPSHLLTKAQPHIHPMDTQMMIFHCADDFMRQYISNKLSICQFALPLLVPNPCTSEIEFPLWSFGQIKRSWSQVEKSEGENTVTSFNNQLLSQAPMPIVSFIRVVNSAVSSKSQILNSLLSKHKHDTFFHRHCRGSSKSCLLMGGVVEISWFCPGGSDKDRFDRCVAFTNLHGDAKEYKKQLRFLQEIASVTVVLVSASDQSEGTRDIVRELWNSPKPLVYLFDDKDKSMGNKSSQRVRIGIRNRNEAELMDELTGVINHLLKFSVPFPSLEECADIARQHGFLVDVDRKECQEARRKAQALIHLMNENKLSKMKEQLLPLQGELWHQWCSKDKELCHLQKKGNRSLEQHKAEIETEKQRIRNTQINRAFPLNALMKSVLEILQSHSNTDRNTELYFLQWMTMFMDKLTRGPLENLFKRHNQLWSQLLTENPKSSKNETWKQCRLDLDAVSKEIRESSLGIEHLLREFGQIYEAIEEASSEKDIVFSLPQIAADLMVSGYPFELMDGDASYVPLKWVAAVFDRLTEKIGDRKLFVLSVLGLQSTGKSTLLNAMFGLQFNVSAGRCTRGAYMQLLQVEKTFQEELGFDFVLVVDTEGLRAPELSSKSQKWDNELATFVIGIGNLTLISIFGENPSEMQDILQIAVQAFLRMKQVKISPSCFFVHQNVGEITAKDQNMEGRRRLQQRLDEMTAIAAEQEHCSDISCFSDVIRFNVNTHVYYFPHLWEGDPPMAPPNHTYSHNIQELKKRILLSAKEESKGSILKISALKVRIQDLWKALINENFIFSFKNTQEIMAMSKLEIKYNDWTWQLRSHVLDLQNKLTNQIQNGEIQDLRRGSIEEKVAEKYDRIRQEFQKYFNEDEECEILIQWKGNFENKLENLKERLISELMRKSSDLFSLRKNQCKLNERKSEYEKELLSRSKDMALSLMGKELSEEELKEIFSQLWNKWVSEVVTNSPPSEDPRIDVDFENVFLEHFIKEHNVQTKLQHYYRSEQFSVDYEKHVSMKMKHKVFQLLHLGNSKKETIDKTTNNIISVVSENIDSRSRNGMDYDINYFHEILQLVEKMTDSASDETEYTLTSEYKMDLCLHLFQRAAAKFEDMHRAFMIANDPVIYLESKREDFFMNFKISCKGAISITVFADFLGSKISAALPIAIWKKMALELADEIRATCPAFSGNRSNLEKHVLIFLAEKDDFDDYMKYIFHPEDFLKYYTENQIISYFVKSRNENLETCLSHALESFKKVILSAIYESTMIAKDQNNSLSVWLDTLCKVLGCHLTFPREDLRSIEHQKITDIEFLKEAMVEYLDTKIQKIGKDWNIALIQIIVPEIKAMLTDQFRGCWKQCPFCKATCTNTIPNHDGYHSVPFHRSQALGGLYMDKTNEFSLDFCTSSVASNNKFLVEGGKWIPFKTYQQAGGEYAKWNITPDSSAQKYWKWFLCHFRAELEKYYNLQFKGKGQIPDQWTSITKEDVLTELNKQ